MSSKTKQHDKAFKEDAIKYAETHPELTQEECARNLGIGLSTLSRWRRETRNAGGEVPYRGSGNYASEEAKEIARLKKRILQIYHASYQNYGAPKITQILRREGEAVSERTVGQYMREMEILNVPTRPGAQTLPTSGLKKGFVYLASVMDLFSRRIIAWTLSKTPDSSFVVDVVNLAKARRNVNSPLILHSNRGCQYDHMPVNQQIIPKSAKQSKTKKADSFPFENT